MSYIFGQHINFNKNTTSKFRVENLISAPSLVEADKGYIYHNTASKAFLGWDGTTWINFGSGGGSSTGLENIGGGWRLIGRPPTDYVTLGAEAVDLSYKSLWTNIGASGYGSFAQGEDVKARQYGSIAMGSLIDNNDIVGFATGINHITAGYVNTVFGVGQRVTGMGCMAVGQAAEIITSGTASWNAYPTKELFVVGNGTVQDSDYTYSVLTRSNAFKVLFNGEVTAPSLTIAKINAAISDKILTTREWVLKNTTRTLIVDTGGDYLQAPTIGIHVTSKTWTIPANTLPEDCILVLKIKCTRVAGSGNPFLSLYTSGATSFRFLHGVAGYYATRHIVIRGGTIISAYNVSGSFYDDLDSPSPGTPSSTAVIDRTLALTMSLELNFSTALTNEYLLEFLTLEQLVQ